jgi:hypothetical protein
LDAPTPQHTVENVTSQYQANCNWFMACSFKSKTLLTELVVTFSLDIKIIGIANYRQQYPLFKVQSFSVC